MLIKVKPGSAREHQKLRQADSDAQYRLQRGMALSAREVKATGQAAVDAGGRPLYHCNQMAERFGFKEIEKRIKGRSTSTTIVLGSGVGKRK